MADITKNELELLKMFWDLGETTAREIYERALIVKKRHYSTIKTTLDIMEKKKILKRRMIGPVYLYSPRKTRKKYLNKLMNDCVKTVFNGSAVPFFISYINKSKITEEEFYQLKNIVDDYKSIYMA